MNTVYKASRYNLLSDDFNGDFLIANLLQTSFLKGSKEQGDEIRQLLNKEEITQEEAREYSQLLEAGILVPKNRNEYEIANLRFNDIVYSKDMLDITIIPTDACNFNCGYCYQEKRHNQFITKESENKILKFLERNVKNYKKVQIGWFGGEPLLLKDRMYSLLEKAKEICNKYHVPLIGKITSNGYLLDLETFQKLLQFNVVHYQITIDGNRETHNQQRPHKTNEDSFDRILQNLKTIAQNEKRYYRIAIRVNITKNILSNINEYLDELAVFAGNEHFQIHWQYVKDYGGEQVHSMTEDRIFESNDFVDFINLATKRGIGSLSYMFFGVGNGLCEAPRKYSYFIDHEAKLHKCTIALYQDDTSEVNNIGYINEQGVAVIDEEKEAVWLIRDTVDEECENCVYFPLCMAQTCPYGRKLRNKKVCINEKDELVHYMRYLAKTSLFKEYRKVGEENYACV